MSNETQDFINSLPTPCPGKAASILKAARHHKGLDPAGVNSKVLAEPRIKAAWEYYEQQSIDDQLQLQLVTMLEATMFRSKLRLVRSLNDRWNCLPFNKKLRLWGVNATKRQAYMWMDDEHKEAMKSTIKETAV